MSATRSCRAALAPRRRTRSYTRPVVRGTDYELARRAVLRDLAAGRVSRTDVCDAHPELLRAARNVGERVGKPCPVCKSRHLYYVLYVYGDRLRHANGRALSQPDELEKLARKHDEFDCYVVEVCTDCSWNHLGRRELHGRKAV
jgi:hypothetical protein